MVRPLRIEFSGALYHVTSRGDRRETIFEDDEDRVQFLSVLAEVVERFNWLCHAYCLEGERGQVLPFASPPRSSTHVPPPPSGIQTLVVVHGPFPIIPFQV